MKVIVTGAAGFIASNLIPRLLRAGHEVVGVDNFSLGKKAYVAPFLDAKNFRFIELDLLHRDLTITLFRDFQPDVLWHLAANSDISYGTTYTDFDLNGGTLVTYNVLEGMRLAQVQTIIFSSSGAVYGEPAVIPTPENYGPIFPISLYAASKVACETLITAFAHNYDMRCWMYRFGNVVGPNPTHGVIHDFVLRLREDPSRLQVLGDGSQSKPYLYIDDCLEGMVFGWQHATEQINCFNLAVDDQTTVTLIAEWTIDAMNIDRKGLTIEYSGGSRGWKGDVPYVNLDTSKMRILGWVPKLKSDEAVRRAIRDTVEQFRNGPV